MLERLSHELHSKIFSSFIIGVFGILLTSTEPRRSSDLQATISLFRKIDHIISKHDFLSNCCLKKLDQ